MTKYSDLSELQEEVGSWSRANFGDQDPTNPLIGAGEEVGELAGAVIDSHGSGGRRLDTLYMMYHQSQVLRSVLKNDQGIRQDEDRVSKEAESEHVRYMRWAGSSVVNQYGEGLKEPTLQIDTQDQMDAVGDIIVYLADYCERNDIDMAECVELAWNGEVKDREWTDK